MVQGCMCEYTMEKGGPYQSSRVGSPSKSPGKQSAKSPSSPMRVSPAQKTALRNLIEQKEREINEASDQRIRILESRIMELQEALARCDSEKTNNEAKLLGLGRDFDYNLKLLEERDFEIDRLEGIVKGMRNAAEGSEQNMGSTRRRLQDLEAEQLTWKKTERDLKWRIEQLEGRAKDAAKQHQQELHLQEDEAAERHRRAEEELSRLKDELVQERAELCTGYEQKLQEALMAEEELQATITRQSLELAEASRKEEDAWQAAEERENRANELGGVVEQFENAVTALQELEAKHSQLVTEHSQFKAKKEDQIKVLERHVEELKLQEARRVSHFEQKVHELARAQESVEAAYQLSQQESSSMEERLQDSLRKSAAEGKKLKTKLKESEVRVMRLAKETEHYKVVAEQQQGLTEQTRGQGETLRQELHDKVAALARLQEQVLGLENRHLDLKRELKTASDSAKGASRERDAALAKAAQAEEQARAMEKRAMREQMRNLELAREFLEASENPGKPQTEQQPTEDLKSSAEFAAALLHHRSQRQQQDHQHHQGMGPGSSVEGLLSSLASDSEKFADDFKNWTPLKVAKQQAPADEKPPQQQQHEEEEEEEVAALQTQAISEAETPIQSSSMGSFGALPSAATAPLPRAQGGGGSPGVPVASASPPLRSAPLQSSTVSLQQRRRRQWEEEEARLREQRDERQRELRRKEVQERESRRRATQDEAVRTASQRRVEAETHRTGQAVEFYQSKASQLSAENQRLRRQMAEAQGQAGGAGWGQPLSASMGSSDNLPGSFKASPTVASHHYQGQGFLGDQSSRLSASGGALLGASQGSVGTGRAFLNSSIGAGAEEPRLRRQHHYAQPLPGSAVTKSYDPAERASINDSLLDKSDVHVHVNVYESSADEVNVSCSSPIRDRSNASSPIRGGGSRNSMSFRIRSPDRGSEPVVELYNAPSSAPLEAEWPQQGESLSRARERILSVKAEMEKAQMMEPRRSNNAKAAGGKRSGQRKGAPPSGLGRVTTRR